MKRILFYSSLLFCFLHTLNTTTLYSADQVSQTSIETPATAPTDTVPKYEIYCVTALSIADTSAVRKRTYVTSSIPPLTNPTMPIHLPMTLEAYLHNAYVSFVITLRFKLGLDAVSDFTKKFDLETILKAQKGAARASERRSFLGNILFHAAEQLRERNLSAEAALTEAYQNFVLTVEATPLKTLTSLLLDSSFPFSHLTSIFSYVYNVEQKQSLPTPSVVTVTQIWWGKTRLSPEATIEERLVFIAELRSQGKASLDLLRVAMRLDSSSVVRRTAENAYLFLKIPSLLLGP